MFARVSLEPLAQRVVGRHGAELLWKQEPFPWVCQVVRWRLCAPRGSDMQSWGACFPSPLARCLHSLCVPSREPLPKGTLVW